MPRILATLIACLILTVPFGACKKKSSSNSGGTAAPAPVPAPGPAPVFHTLSVSTSGAGEGTVTSSPAGISCPGTCQFDFVEGSTVTLTASPQDSFSALTAWSGGCAGNGGCQVAMASSTAVGAEFAALSVNGTYNGTTSIGGPVFIQVTSHQISLFSADPVVSCRSVNVGDTPGEPVQADHTFSFTFTTQVAYSGSATGEFTDPKTVSGELNLTITTCGPLNLTYTATRP